jgi:nicotinic acid phosphoribosyltransferase
MVLQNSQALFTDLYELTMAASYFQHRMFAPATFSLFVRKLPLDRGFLVAAGLEVASRVSTHSNKEDSSHGSFQMDDQVRVDYQTP